MYETKRGKKITRAFYKTETGTVFTKKSSHLLRKRQKKNEALQMLAQKNNMLEQSFHY